MLLFSTVIAWFILILYFLYVIGKAYIDREFLDPIDAKNTADLSDLTVIIPARNEASNIRRCLTSLLNQPIQSHTYRVIVVDDNSMDATADIVRQLKASDPRLHLVSAGKLRQGWTGKNHACWKGVELAGGNWYCFIDADIQAEPGLLTSALHFAKSRGIDLLSLNPFQELVTATERLLLPAVFLSIASSMNFRHVNDPKRPEAIANGQFMLFRRQVYEAIGGHSEVRSEIMEDLAFAQIIKQSGYRLRWLFADDLIRVRMYRHLSQMWEGFSKNLTEIHGYTNSAASMLGALRFLALGWLPLVLPVLSLCCLFTGQSHLLDYATFGVSIFATAILSILFTMTLKALKIPLSFALGFPLGFTFQALLILHSQWQRITKTRRWKERICG